MKYNINYMEMDKIAHENREKMGEYGKTQLKK